LPDDLDEETVIAAAAREGVAVASVSPYRLSPAPRGGLILGYSNLTERVIAEGVSRLARAVSSIRERTATATTPTTKRPPAPVEMPSRR
jgi:GntR family transcriptional regulator/MocR family aminotransferase